MHIRAALAVFVATLAIPSVVLAQSVTVLGIRSIEGDDEFTANLSGALRHAASEVNGWDVSDRDMSLAQMSLALGCEDADAACMAQISETLGAERVIYGTVRRTSSGERYSFSVSLSLFNAESGEIEQTLTDTIPQIMSDIDQLRPRVSRYVAQLSGAARMGTLHVIADVDGAEVYVDDELAGSIAGQDFSVEIEAGAHRVEIRAEGYHSSRQGITVVADEEARVEVELVDTGSGGSTLSPLLRKWPAWLSFGASAIFGVLTVVAWQKIDCGGGSGLDLCEDDPIMLSFRTHVGTRVTRTVDVCAEAQAGLYYGGTAADRNRGRHVASLCDSADFWEPLQYVFLGLTAISAAAGIYFLMDDDEDDPSESTVTLMPTVAMEGGGFTARVEF